jgi:hypothetical protein
MCGANRDRISQKISFPGRALEAVSRVDCSREATVGPSHRDGPVSDRTGSDGLLLSPPGRTSWRSIRPRCFRPSWPSAAPPGSGSAANGRGRPGSWSGWISSACWVGRAGWLPIPRARVKVPFFRSITRRRGRPLSRRLERRTTCCELLAAAGPIGVRTNGGRPFNLVVGQLPDPFRLMAWSRPPVRPRVRK